MDPLDLPGGGLGGGGGGGSVDSNAALESVANREGFKIPSPPSLVGVVVVVVVGLWFVEFVASVVWMAVLVVVAVFVAMTLFMDREGFVVDASGISSETSSSSGPKCDCPPLAALPRRLLKRE